MSLPKTGFSMVLTANQTLESMDIAVPDIAEDSAIL